MDTDVLKNGEKKLNYTNVEVKFMETKRKIFTEDGWILKKPTNKKNPTADQLKIHRKYHVDEVKRRTCRKLERT